MLTSPLAHAPPFRLSDGTQDLQYNLDDVYVPCTHRVQRRPGSSFRHLVGLDNQLMCKRVQNSFEALKL
jgi:hypothetical protein